MQKKLLFSLLFIILFSSSVLSLSNIQAKEKSLTFEVDSKCRITKLSLNEKDARNWGGIHGIWRIIYKQNDKIDEQWADLSASKVFIENNKIIAHFDGKFKVNITIEKYEDRVEFSAVILNENPNSKIVEFHFPMIKSLAYKKSDSIKFSNVIEIEDLENFMSSASAEEVRPEHKAKHFIFENKDNGNDFEILETDSKLLFKSPYSEDSPYVRCHNKNIIDVFFRHKMSLDFNEKTSIKPYKIYCIKK